MKLTIFAHTTAMLPFMHYDKRIKNGRSVVLKMLF